MGVEELILLATADPDTGAVMDMVLRHLELPYRLEVVHSGNEVMRCFPIEDELETSPFPQLLLLDLKIIKPRALDVLRWIRNCPSARDLPVVVLAESVFDKNIIRAYREGANSFLVKADGYTTILEQVREIDQEWLTGRTAPLNGRSTKPLRKQLSPWAGTAPTSHSRDGRRNGAGHLSRRHVAPAAEADVPLRNGEAR